MSMRKKFYDGFVTSDEAALEIAKRILKGCSDGTKLLLGFYNGVDMFIKEESGNVRVSDAKEFESYVSILK